MNDTVVNIGDKVIVTTNEWFYAPNGRAYRSVWGTVRGILGSEDTLGVRTNSKSTNWYAVIGDTTVAGCQIQYFVRCDQPPPAKVRDQHVADGKVLDFERESFCWDADAAADQD